MYETHFGLAERPFALAPDPRYLFLGERHREALAHLRYGIGERGGFVVLTGEVGTGKTLLTRALLTELPASVDVALVLNPKLTVAEFLLTVFRELKVAPPRRSHSVQSLVDHFNRYLLEAYAHGRHTVILIDEAHCLNPLVLEQIRLLTNLETERAKLLQIILVGQPELRALLAQRELRAVAQRVTARYHLGALSLAETRQYLAHRAHVAGARGPLFSRAAQWLIHRQAGGIPRLTNIIADRALLGACTEGQPQVDLLTAWRAAREVAGRSPRRWLLPAATAASLLLAVSLAWQAGGRDADRPLADAETAALALASEPVLEPADAPMAAAEPLAEPAAPPALADWLPAQAAASAPEPALAALLARWGGPLTAAEASCERALDLGLRCYRQRGDWEALRRKNLPALLTLRDADGGRHQVLAQDLRDDGVTLHAGPASQRFDLAELEPHWHGEYLVLWRPPALGRELIVRGQRGPAVEWLAQRLDRIEGREPRPAAGRVFDRGLEDRVRAFQLLNRLQVDGMVGEHTLIHLMAALPEPGQPVLTP